jgi:hypothetical protein
VRTVFVVVDPPRLVAVPPAFREGDPLISIPSVEERSLVDPFAEAKRTWILYLILAVLAGAFLALWRAH